MKECINKYKVYTIIFIIAIVILTLFIGIKYLVPRLYEKLPEVKLREIKNSEAFAIMVPNENGDDYVEYKNEDNTWPSNTKYTFSRAECVDNNGEIIYGALTYNNEKRTAILEVDKTVYCTLFFDYIGTGEKEHPYRIQYIEDLLDIQVAVNNGETYEGTYFELARNLDFQKIDSYQNYQTKEYGDINGNSIDEELKTELTTGRGWKPIGLIINNEKKEFSGTLDGKNHRIDHLYINNDINGSNIGLFGNITNGEINNLTIGGKITTSENANIGVFIANAVNVKMNNCHNEVNITSNVGRYQVGGLIGVLKGTSEITNCTNVGNISNGNSTAGIIANIGTGFTEISNVKIENCENRGIITNSLGSSAMGGIIGRTETVPSNLTLTNCKNYGLITTGNSIASEQKIGGIMGVAGSGSIVVIQNSDNYGEVRSEYNEANTSFIGNGGGIIGRVDGSSNKTVAKIINSNNHAEINGMRRGGGLVGQVNSGGTLYIDKSHNEGNITSSLYANYDDSCGGMVGLINNGKAYVLNTYNKGNISSQLLSASGMIGNFDTNTANVFMAINSYNIGKITNSRDKASGIIHSFYNNGNARVTLSLNNVYTVGTLSGTENYGLGNLGTNTQFNGINNVYHSSDYATSNLSVTGVTTKSTNDMKSNTFVNLLNTNKDSISLSSLDNSLNGYTLCNWKMGESGYPDLAC